MPDGRTGFGALFHHNPKMVEINRVKAPKNMSRAADNKLKKLAIEQLKKTPIIQAVCEKIGLPRTNFYRWKNNDPAFAEAVDSALNDGRRLINDFAESQLLSAMKEGNLTAIIYWLNHNHKTYANKLHITGKIKSDGRLTPEQQERIMKVVELTSMLGINNPINNIDTGEPKNNNGTTEKNGKPNN